MLHARHGTGGSLHVKLMLFIMCGKSIRNGHGGILSDRTPCLTRLAAHFFFLDRDKMQSLRRTSINRILIIK